MPEWNKNAAGIKAFYFRDPDGHPLELISFPRGKGDPRWQRDGEDLFLGIDHTAIAVEDTERSLRFYRDMLGFRVTGGSLNYGTEQEHLNHVFGSRVRITSLRSSAGPGIEFLEYVTPRDGRRGGLRAEGVRRGGPAGGRRLGDAGDHPRQHERRHDHDRGEGGRPDPRAATTRPRQRVRQGGRR